MSATFCSAALEGTGGRPPRMMCKVCCVHTRLRCDSWTAFGAPELPAVKTMIATSSSSTPPRGSGAGCGGGGKAHHPAMTAGLIVFGAAP